MLSEVFRKVKTRSWCFIVISNNLKPYDKTINGCLFATWRYHTIMMESKPWNIFGEKLLRWMDGTQNKGTLFSNSIHILNSFINVSLKWYQKIRPLDHFPNDYCASIFICIICVLLYPTYSAHNENISSPNLCNTCSTLPSPYSLNKCNTICS